jgi:hypothetical protein
MDPNRRNFLLGTVGFLGGTIYTLIRRKTGLIALTADSQDDSCIPINNGRNLQGWEIALGDAIMNCEGEPPVSSDDIETIHYPEYSELRANIRRRAIMAHNITFKRFIDDNAFDFVHRCGYDFRLPFLPVPDENESLSAQTLEGGIFIWDGKATRLDYGMGFQWILNPWSNSSTIYTWQTDEAGIGQWVYAGKLELYTEWHTINMVVDYQMQITSLTIDNNAYQSQFTGTQKPPHWAEETAARLQAEIVSVSPEPACVMKAMHQAQFKNWYWIREHCQFLPIIAKPLPTPTNTPTLTPTATVTPTSTPIPTPQPTPNNCYAAQITSLITNEHVTSPVTVSWVPDTCKMVVQYYQNGQFLGEWHNVHSGIQIEIPSPGLTEIKIWKDGASLPADYVWVIVD